MQIQDWGLIPYTEAWEKQKEVVQQVIDGAENQLIFCEHNPVLTLGRMFQEQNLLFSREELYEKGVEVVSIDRGGDVTLHNPGQLVVYPIFALKEEARDLRKYLQILEKVVIDFLCKFDILSTGSEDQRGVWVGPKKIASMGIGVRKWVTYHGLAINISNDLEQFRLIRPCGLDVEMESVEGIIGSSLPMEEAKEKIVESFEKVFLSDQKSMVSGQKEI